MVIANGENSAGGFGISPETATELFDDGVDVLTSGNHIWKQKDILPYLDEGLPIIRPINYPPGAPGRGYLISKQVAVVNIMGRTFMGDIDCPFRAMDALLARLDPKPPIIIVDFHAEATSEKMAMGHYLDGRVSALLGTHTHVATADARIMPQGTAYMTDIGMAGPINSVIGDDAEAVIKRFLTAMPVRFTVASGKAMLNGVLLDINDKSGRAQNIERVYAEVD